MKKILIWLLALAAGAVLGVLGIGWVDQLMEFVASTYTRLFQLLAVPTIMLAVTTTFADFGSKGSGKIFGRTLTYTLLTTFAATAVGAALYVAIAPGNLPVETVAEGSKAMADTPSETYYDHVLSVVPNNIVRPLLEGNVLSLLLLAFAIGIALAKMPPSDNKAVVVKGLLGLQELLFMLIRGLIRILPAGIVAFAAQLSAQLTAGVVADSIGRYVLVVLGGNVVQFFVVLPLLLTVRGLNPIRVLGGMMPAVLMALFTKSSAGRESPGCQKECGPLRAAHLHHNQHERLRCLHPRDLAICDAKRRNAYLPAHGAPLDAHSSGGGCGQRRSADGMLLPHALTDVGHRNANKHHGHHSAHLHHHRHGGNGRERMV